MLHLPRESPEMQGRPGLLGSPGHPSDTTARKLFLQSELLTSIANSSRAPISVIHLHLL